MSEEEAGSHARDRLLCRAGADGQFSAVQRPLDEKEIVAVIEPPGEPRSLDDVNGFGGMHPKD
jgi:hypothetical protein